MYILKKNKVAPTTRANIEPVKQTNDSTVANIQKNDELDNTKINEPQVTPNKALPVEVENEISEITKPTYHVVSRGENLYRISLQYNIKMQTLVEWNNLVDESEIYNGMRLSLVEPVPVE